jgi:hypothetical protein
MSFKFLHHYSIAITVHLADITVHAGNSVVQMVSRELE